MTHDKPLSKKLNYPSKSIVTDIAKHCILTLPNINRSDSNVKRACL